MPEVRVTLNIEVDGQAMPNMPVIRRYSEIDVNVISQTQNPDGDSVTFHGIAAAVMNTLEIFYIAPNQALNIDINQLAAMPLNANGLILVLGTSLQQADPSTNVTLNNPSVDAIANVVGLVAGSTNSGPSSGPV